MNRVVTLAVLLGLVLVSGEANAVFTDVTAEAFGCSPADILGWANAYWPDYNNDGWPDLHTSVQYLYVNNGDGTFTLNTTTGLDVEHSSNTYRVCWADADNDGDLDCIQACFSNSTPDVTYKAYYYESSGAPDYTFTRYEYYSIPNYTRAGTPLFVDGDADGFYEIYQATFGNWDPYRISGDLYFEGDGGEIWTDVTTAYIPQLGTTEYNRHTRGLAACDYDNDTDVDIFVPVYGVEWSDPSWENMLWQNDGSGHFTDVATEAGVAIEPHGRYGIGLASGASWGDYDNDGDFDLAVANIHGWVAVYRNEGDGTFTNITEDSGLMVFRKEWHNTAWVDVDNDEDLDLFCSQWYEKGAMLFENLGPDSIGYFRQENLKFGLDLTTTFCALDGAVGAADYDRDGDMDIFFDGGRLEYAGKYLYRNDLDPETENNHWLIVQLQGDGTTCGLTASGAKIRFKYADGWSGIRQVETASADMGMHMHAVHFGLGSHDALEEIRVWWPRGRIEYWTWEDIGQSVDHWITLVEGAGHDVAGVEDVIPTGDREPGFGTIYPNPARDMVTCTLAIAGATEVEVTLYDITGRLVRTQKLRIDSGSEACVAFDVGDLPVGVYAVRAAVAGRAASAKVVILR